MRTTSLALMIILVPLAACGDDESIEFPTEPLSVERGFRSSHIVLGGDDEAVASPVDWVWGSTPQVHTSIEELISFVEGSPPSDLQGGTVGFAEERSLPSGAAILCYDTGGRGPPDLWPRESSAVCFEVPDEPRVQIDLRIQMDFPTLVAGLPMGSTIALVQTATDSSSTVGSCLEVIDDDACLDDFCELRLCPDQ